MSAEALVVGQCDTPTCAKTADEITPEGWVCSSCAREIEQEYREAERLERRAQR